MKYLSELFHHHRFRLLLVMFVFLAVDLGVMIVPLESGQPGANIITLDDGIWWSVTTMTGVGYGDTYPVSSAGRLLGGILQILGVLVFGLIVGHIALVLFSVREKYYWGKLDRRLDEIDSRLGRMEKLQKFMLEEKK